MRSVVENLYAHRDILFLRLVLLISGLHSFYAPEAVMLTQPIALLALLPENMLKSSALWIPVTCVSTLFLMQGYYFVGNQKFVHLYTCLAILMCLNSRESFGHTLQRCALILLVYVFCSAAFWKLSSPSFRHGDMMAYLMLPGGTFSPFGQFADWLAGTSQPPETMQLNAETLRQLRQAQFPVFAHLSISPALATAALVLSWYSLLTQAAIGLTALVNLTRYRKPWTEWVMHILLVEFIIIAYPLTQVLGFGMLLCAIGIASLSNRTRALLPVYLLLAGVLMWYDLPWSRLLGGGSWTVFASY
ncbi:MAG: hypothetical protein GC134_03245 [Proteobacteria bacterium]|nr:hypothetical protein [Pseudomonadota bacterium]